MQKVKPREKGKREVRVWSFKEQGCQIGEKLPGAGFLGAGRKKKRDHSQK